MKNKNQCIITLNREELQNVILEQQNPHRHIIRHVEKAMIQESLIMARGSQTKAAELCGMTRNTFRKRLIDFGLIKTRN